MGFGGVSGEAERARVVVKGRRLEYSQETFDQLRLHGRELSDRGRNCGPSREHLVDGRGAIWAMGRSDFVTEATIVVYSPNGRVFHRTFSIQRRRQRQKHMKVEEVGRE